jgi:hypothetical protein
MSFTAITSGEIESGDPVKASTLTKIKNDLDDHETRLLTVEASTSAFPPIILRVGGRYPQTTSILKTTANFSFQITGVRLLIDTAGASGDTEIDIQRKRGVGSFESILTTLPKVNYADGDDALSTNTVINLSKDDVEAADILRLDITSAQTNGIGFLVRIDYVRS